MEKGISLDVLEERLSLDRTVAERIPSVLIFFYCDVSVVPRSLPDIASPMDRLTRFSHMAVECSYAIYTTMNAPQRKEEEKSNQIIKL